MAIFGIPPGRTPLDVLVRVVPQQALRRFPAEPPAGVGRMRPFGGLHSRPRASTRGWGCRGRTALIREIAPRPFMPYLTNTARAE